MLCLVINLNIPEQFDRLIKFKLLRLCCLIIVQIHVIPSFGEGFESLLAHQDDDDVALGFFHVLDEFGIHLVEKHFIVDVQGRLL